MHTKIDSNKFALDQSNLLSFEMITIQKELARAKEKNCRIAEGLKIKIVELSKLIKPVEVAKSLDLNESTLSKWRKKYGKSLSKERTERDQEREEQLSTSNEDKKRFPLLTASFIFFAFILLLLEFYLLSNSYTFQVVQYGLSRPLAIIKALLIEVVPISLILMSLQKKLRFNQKAIVSLCLLVTFCYSVFSVTGLKLNKSLDLISSLQLSRSELLGIERKIESLDRDIVFYKSHKQSSGVTGWPQTVKRLIGQRKELGNRQILINKRLEGQSSLYGTIVNLVFDLLVQLSLQCGSLLISYRLFSLVEISKKESRFLGGI